MTLRLPPSLLRRARRAIPWALLATGAACRDEKPQSHVYRSLPPAAPRPASVVDNAPVLPLGTMGPEARIQSVSETSTGAPLALDQVGSSVNVLILAARGPHRPNGERATILLELRGPSDTTLTLPLGNPAPSIVAHEFAVPVGTGGSRGLRSGRYTARVRLLASGDTIATSVPIHFSVRSTPQMPPSR